MSKSMGKSMSKSMSPSTRTQNDSGTHEQEHHQRLMLLQLQHQSAWAGGGSSLVADRGTFAYNEART